MAASYRQLAANSRYLRRIQFEGGELREIERLEAELSAAIEIESQLGKTFSTGTSTPGLIRLLADLLGSAHVLEYVALDQDFGTEANDGARKASYLRAKAQQIIDDLRSHKIGILNTDGSYDASYPQPDVLPTIQQGEAKPITIQAGLAWGEMAQPQMTTEEKQALDDTVRNRRAEETAAAWAGAYGV